MSAKPGRRVRFWPNSAVQASTSVRQVKKNLRRPSQAENDPKRTLDERLLSSTHIFYFEYLSDLQYALAATKASKAPFRAKLAANNNV